MIDFTIRPGEFQSISFPYVDEDGLPVSVPTVHYPEPVGVVPNAVFSLRETSASFPKMTKVPALQSGTTTVMEVLFDGTEQLPPPGIYYYDLMVTRNSRPKVSTTGACRIEGRI